MLWWELSLMRLPAFPIAHSDRFSDVNLPFWFINSWNWNFQLSNVNDFERISLALMILVGDCDFDDCRDCFRTAQPMDNLLHLRRSGPPWAAARPARFSCSYCCTYWPIWHRQLRLTIVSATFDDSQKTLASCQNTSPVALFIIKNA